MPTTAQRVTELEKSIVEIRKWILNAHSLMYGDAPRPATLSDTVTAHDIGARLDNLSKAAESLK